MVRTIESKMVKVAFHQMNTKYRIGGRSAITSTACSSSRLMCPSARKVCSCRENHGPSQPYEQSKRSGKICRDEMNFFGIFSRLPGDDALDGKFGKCLQPSKNR